MKQRISKCQLCGEVRPLTKEHLPQRALYPKSIRHLVGNLNTVAACAQCNNASNVIDELLKVVFGDVAGAAWSDELRASVSATLGKNERLSRLLEENSRIETYQTATGEVREAKVLRLPKELTEPVLGAVERMAKAFYYQTYGRVLVEHYEISSFHPDGLHPGLLREIDEGMRRAEIRAVNGNTVRYSFINANHGDIVCVVNIYGNLQFYFVLKELGWREKLPNHGVQRAKT